MGSVIHRTTLEQRDSVSTPDYPLAQWIHNPDISALIAAGVPRYYWKVVGDSVVEMTAGEKATVDATRLVAAKRTARVSVEGAWTKYLQTRYSNQEQIVFTNLLINAVRTAKVNRANYIEQMLVWMNSVTQHYTDKLAEIQAAGTVAAVQAVAWNFQSFTASDPNITIPGALAIAT